MMKSILISALTAFASTAAFARDKQKALCTLKVDGVYYLKNEICGFKKEKNGSFTVGISDTSKTRSKYFAYVNVEDDGTATGSWNGKEAETHAQEDLGRLVHQRDGCWSNDHAIVCAK